MNEFTYPSCRVGSCRVLEVLHAVTDDNGCPALVFMSPYSVAINRPTVINLIADLTRWAADMGCPEAETPLEAKVAVQAEALERHGQEIKELRERTHSTLQGVLAALNEAKSSAEDDNH